MARTLLGDDGRGYELARRLDFCGAWRAWLGESAYASFAPSLSSPSAWDSFLSPANPNVRLHLRARALLYDKASVALATRHASPSDHSALAPSSLQLHGDDVYYSLEDAGRDGDDAATAQAQSGLPSSPSKSSGGSRIKSSNAGARAVESENENSIQKDKHDSLQDLWYDKFIEKYRSSRHLKFPFADCNSMKRTPEGMSSYLKLITLQKRRRVGFKDDESMTVENGTIRQLEKMEDDIFVIPELMFPFNCVPDNTILPPAESESPQKLEFYGVLDSLPHLITPSRTMIERLGIRPEYLKVEFGRSKYRGKKGSEATRESLSSDQVLQLAHRVVAQALVNAGLDGGSDISIQILSQFLGSYICKLGRNLKILTDSYRMQFTSTELINMFLKTIGCGNLGALSDYLKKITRNLPHQSQQAHSLPGQQEIHHLPTHQQQIQRPMLSQQNTHRPQNMVFQQVQMQQQQLQFLQQQHIQMQMQQQQQQIYIYYTPTVTT